MLKEHKSIFAVYDHRIEEERRDKSSCMFKDLRSSIVVKEDGLREKTFHPGL
jgi:hypothetical protein